MRQELQELSYLLMSLILIILVMIPLFTTIQNGFDSTDNYYQTIN